MEKEKQFEEAIRICVDKTTGQSRLDIILNKITMLELQSILFNHAFSVARMNGTEIICKFCHKKLEPIIGTSKVIKKIIKT